MSIVKGALKKFRGRASHRDNFVAPRSLIIERKSHAAVKGAKIGWRESRFSRRLRNAARRSYNGESRGELGQIFRARVSRHFAKRGENSRALPRAFLQCCREGIVGIRCRSRCDSPDRRRPLVSCRVFAHPLFARVDNEVSSTPATSALIERNSAAVQIRVMRNAT